MYGFWLLLFSTKLYSHTKIFKHKINENDSLSLKLSVSQINKWKLATKNATGVTLISLWNMTSNSNGTTFLNKLLMTDRQVVSLRKTFENNLSSDVKSSLNTINKVHFLVIFLDYLYKLFYL